MAEVLIARGALVEEADAAPWATPIAWAKNESQPNFSLLDGTQVGAWMS